MYPMCFICLIYVAASAAVEVTVQVLLGGDSSILGQYVDFCQVADKQRMIHGLTKTAIQETIRICQERAILVPFLTARRKEVIDIIEMLFSQEEVWEMTKREVAKDAANDRDNLYAEFLKRLIPMGRINDLLAASTDKSKLAALAQEFGLKI